MSTIDRKRRRAARAEIDVPAVVRVRDAREAGAREIPGAIENLGPDGAFIRTEATARLAQGDEIVLAFRIDAHPLPFEIGADVRWVRTEPPAGIGVQFKSVAPFDRTVIDDYCQRRIEEGRAAVEGGAGED